MMMENIRYVARQVAFHGTNEKTKVLAESGI
jgi:hypothetical protein